METNVIVEQPILSVSTPYGEVLNIYADELVEAKVGKVWKIMNQDCYPNRTCTWDDVFEVIYKNDSGVGVLFRHMAGEPEEEDELIWVKLHEHKKENEE